MSFVQKQLADGAAVSGAVQFEEDGPSKRGSLAACCEYQAGAFLPPKPPFLAEDGYLRLCTRLLQVAQRSSETGCYLRYSNNKQPGPGLRPALRGDRVAVILVVSPDCAAPPLYTAQMASQAHLAFAVIAKSAADGHREQFECFLTPNVRR